MTLRLKITLAQTATGLALLGIVGGTLFHAITVSIEGAVDDLLRERVSKSVRLRPPEGARPDFRPPKLHNPPPRFAEMFWDSPMFMNEAGVTQFPMPDALPAARILGSMSGPDFRTVTGPSGDRWRVLTQPIGKDGERLQVAMRVDQLYAVRPKVRDAFFLLVPVAAILATLAGLISGWSSTRRLRKLVDEVEAIDPAMPVDRVSETGSDEVSQVGRSFNRLLDRLADGLATEREARLLQEQFGADASHELKTPLATIIASLESDHPEARDRARQAAIEAAKMVEDLLVIATSPPDSSLRLLDLEECARSVHLHPRVSVTVGASSPVVGQQPEVIRAIRNLVDNALKYSDGPVRVHVEKATVSVSDCGPGIAQADRERIFERFYRGRDAETKPGAGLGLAIVTAIMERHHGEVELGSGPEGSIFRLHFPPAQIG